MVSTRSSLRRTEKLAVVATSTGIAPNTRGFSALPNELYLEIVSCLPACPIPLDVWVTEKRDPYRQLALYYLTQTCRSLRKFFLKYAWERIEVFGDMWTPKGKLSGRRLAEEILRQLETVNVRNPNLQEYVTTVDLTIPTHSQNAVVHEIAQNLSLFPNLHTLQLIFQSKSSCNAVFSKFRYYNIRTLNLNFRSPLEDILQSCPNTKNFSFYDDDVDHWWTLGLLSGKECAGSIEKLGVMHYSYLHVPPTIVEDLPNLRDLSLCSRTLRIYGDLNSLVSLPVRTILVSFPLHTIRLRLDNFRRRHYHQRVTSDQRRTWIDLAKKVLAKCPQDEFAKRVIVVNDDETVDIYNL